MKPKSKKKPVISGRTILLGICAVLVLGGVIAFIIKSVGGHGDYVSKTDEFVFVRDLRAGTGSQPLDSIAADKHPDVTLANVFDDDRLSRYGSDQKDDDGVGVHIVLRTVVGNRTVSEQAFTLPAWRRYEETENMVRDNQARQAKLDFATLAGTFAGPAHTDRTYALVLDTTSGVSDQLKSRVFATIEQDCVGGGKLRLYQLTKGWYQGAPPVIDCASIDELKADPRITGWLAVSAADNSSVLLGLHGDFVEVADTVRTSTNPDVRVDIFTDGLENSDEQHDMYKHPELLDEANWGMLDPLLNVKGLDLNGVLVTLHPLPQPNEDLRLRMTRALGYIANRLGPTGAVVTTKPN